MHETIKTKYFEFFDSFYSLCVCVFVYVYIEMSSYIHHSNENFHFIFVDIMSWYILLFISLIFGVSILTLLLIYCTWNTHIHIKALLFIIYSLNIGLRTQAICGIYDKLETHILYGHIFLIFLFSFHVFGEYFSQNCFDWIMSNKVQFDCSFLAHFSRKLHSFAFFLDFFFTSNWNCKITQFDNSILIEAKIFYRFFTFLRFFFLIQNWRLSAIFDTCKLRFIIVWTNITSTVKYWIGMLMNRTVRFKYIFE